MNKLIVSLVALSFLGAGCFSSPSKPLIQEPPIASPQEAPRATAPVEESAAKTEALNLMLDVGQLLIDAATAGVDATQLGAWEEEGYVGSRAIRDEDYEAAVITLSALKVQLEAAIAAGQ